ncbi:MAG: hypothetical protein UFJ18_12330 [Blautia sp.]|nr:hypothetical protein [Blautia sp.]
MRMLKDYMKLIFTAVMCFLMKFVSGKGKVSKANVKEKSVGYGTHTAVTERNGLNEIKDACVMKDTMVVYEAASTPYISNKIKKKCFLRIHRTLPVQPVDSPIYNNTG